MAQTKIYPATQAQAQDIKDTVDEINAKIEPLGLASVDVGVLDFLYDDITIVYGGLETIKRRITT
jgi:hypothetical protein